MAHYRVGPSPGAGVGVFATKDFAPGEEILAVADPLVCLPDDAHLESTCSWCAATVQSADAPSTYGDSDGPATLSACTGCKTVKYCNRTCQSASWKAHHKHECPIFRGLHPRILPASVRSLLRLLLLPPAALAPVTALSSHLSSFPRHPNWSTIQLMSHGAAQYSRTSLAAEKVLALYCTLLVNTLTLSTPALTPIGLYFDPAVVARVNHGCNPNAAVTFERRRLRLAALREVKEGEEVKIAYVDTTFPTRVRRRELRGRWFFECACEVCSNAPDVRTDTYRCSSCGDSSIIPPPSSPPSSPPSPPSSPPPSTSCTHCKTPLSTPNPIPALASLEDTVFRTIEKAPLKDLLPHLRRINATGAYAFPRQPVPALHEALQQRFLDAGHLAAAARHACFLYARVDPALYEPVHPVRVCRAFVLAVLFLELAVASGVSGANTADIPNRRAITAARNGGGGEGGGGGGGGGWGGGEMDAAAQAERTALAAFHGKNVDFDLVAAVLLDEAARNVNGSHGGRSMFARRVQAVKERLAAELRMRGGSVGVEDAQREMAQREMAKFLGAGGIVDALVEELR